MTNYIRDRDRPLVITTGFNSIVIRINYFKTECPRYKRGAICAQREKRGLLSLVRYYKLLVTELPSTPRG
jgi:hypothetical protein